jgi:hypothetical protein
MVGGFLIGGNGNTNKIVKKKEKVLPHFYTNKNQLKLFLMVILIKESSKR